MEARRRQGRMSLDVVRREVVEALAGRRAEIEKSIRTRAFAVAGATGTETPGYVEGLWAAIAAALDLAMVAIGDGFEHVGATPLPILVQARSAARSRVSLEVVLRRYAAGYSVLIDFLLAEIRGLETTANDSESILQGELTSLFDRLVEAVGGAYREEGERLGRSSAQRHTDLLRRLLAGESIDRSRFDYDFDAHHLGVVATGPDAEGVLRRAAARIDRRLLLLEHGEGAISGWLGGGREFLAEDLDALPHCGDPHQGSLAIGEPGEGLRGWRLTHRQAEAGFGVGVRGSRPFTRYAEVALLATASRDEDLVAFLDVAFISPLRARQDGGAALFEALRAYLDAGCNVSSAAAALGLARQTVASRLQQAERQIERPLGGCLAELEVALRVRELTD
jgi:PucR C-terminal helix-turn-helix domain